MKKFGAVGTAITIFTFFTGVLSLPDLFRIIERSDWPQKNSVFFPSNNPKKSKGQDSFIQRKNTEEGGVVLPPRTSMGYPASLSKTEETDSPSRVPSATNQFPKIAPSVSWQKTFAQTLREIEGSSQWHSDPLFSSFLTECSVEVFFSEPRLQDAAEIVHRLRTSGANVTFRLVSSADYAVKQDGLYYHWNHLKMAQAIQAIVQDVQILELMRNDQSQLIALWII